MKGILYCLVLALHVVCCVCAASRPLTFSIVHQRELSPWSSKSPLKYDEGFGNMHGHAKMTTEEYKGGVSKIGSTPPDCKNKCFGCIPCEATQVATPSEGDAYMHLDYANYKPIRWTCKCGPSFYIP